MPERDPLDALRGAWNELEAPEATPEQGDAQTEAALVWMRAAWDALEAPEPELPFELRRRSWRVRLVEARPLLLAAAVLLLCAILLPRYLSPRDGQGAGAEEVARVPELPTTPEPQPRPRIEVLESAPEQGLVLQHGSVRLVLLDPIDEFSFEDSNPNTEPDSGFGETQEN